MKLIIRFRAGLVLGLTYIMSKRSANSPTFCRNSGSLIIASAYSLEASPTTQPGVFPSTFAAVVNLSNKFLDILTETVCPPSPIGGPEYHLVGPYISPVIP